VQITIALIWPCSSVSAAALDVLALPTQTECILLGRTGFGRFGGHCKTCMHEFPCTTELLSLLECSELPMSYTCSTILSSSREPRGRGCGAVSLLVEVIWPGWLLPRSAVRVGWVARVRLVCHRLLCACLWLLVTAPAGRRLVCRRAAALSAAVAGCRRCLHTHAQVVARHPVPARAPHRTEQRCYRG
jgi:hypothetical protein